MNGLLVIDKPGGMTSRDVVNRVQRWFPRKTKLGHTGTLDPLATGVLVVCVGAATRLASLVQDMSKTYVSRFRLGARSTTDDADGEVTAVPNAPFPNRAQLERPLAAFVGSIAQVPPAFSAAKIAGKRAYDVVREGKGVDLAPRTVRVDAIRILAYEAPFLDVEIDCGKGTYIRSIARDLGEALGCGALVETLRRTRVGPFRAEDGLKLDDDGLHVTEKLLPMGMAAAELESVALEDGLAERFRRGQVVPCPSHVGGQCRTVAVCNERKELMGLGTVGDEGSIHPSVVLNV